MRDTVGTFLLIPLADGSFGYGRVLSSPYVAFYDYRTPEPVADLVEIACKPLLFSQAVRRARAPRWKALGVRPLEGEFARPVLRFVQDLADFRKCTLYDSARVRLA